MSNRVLTPLSKRLTEDATRLAEDEDPGQALATFLRQAVDQSEVKNALAGLLTSAGIDIPKQEGLRAALGTLLRRAQESGAVRQDLEVPELIGLLAGTSKAMEYAGESAAARGRILDVILNGLR
ncbi:SbtR family transcriptional regulator [Paractinoplanes durhamensis]|uniref:Transcriptional regulator SbtR-like C-terminal domain-containing protein n=1 Tax=Paractinoplanes durhamensis TaxID=113563 RepID=A0ABQ3ZAD5_9ACTN|nr:hypothetical protein [Actinoplanes durhamensis]GIE06780.1 hypothetical protein Adu01nite_81300 [Actinoplanes durhamensis]